MNENIIRMCAQIKRSGLGTNTNSKFIYIDVLMQTLIEHFQMIMPCPLTLMHEGVKKSGGVII